MVFKRFQIAVALRLALLVLNGYAITWVAGFNGYWFTLGNLIFFFLLQLILFFRFLTRWQRDLNVFASSVHHGDYTITFHLLDPRDGHYELYSMLNRISTHIREVKSKFEQQNQYFQYVVENARVGLIAYNDKGKVVLSNREALQLLGVPALRNIQDLQQYDRNLHHQLTSLDLNQPRLITTAQEKPVRLSARLSRFVMEEETVLLLSVLNIRQELEENELQSWQQLISVLTHEIMNSITPIHSLNGSMVKYLDRIDGNADTVAKARESLAVINRRSKALMNFVDRYRKISTVPLPRLERVNVDELITAILTLLSNDLKGIDVNFRSQQKTLLADPALLEQAMINILKNSIAAVASAAVKRIDIQVIHADDRVIISIGDSGPGIPADILDRIFIPFFTTRTGGSGIGLTLSRQIMQRHAGIVEVESGPGKGAIFRLVFPGK
jgi:nitrogen fixation/metabolism regulation signal transduction histidine kinase